MPLKLIGSVLVFFVLVLLGCAKPLGKPFFQYDSVEHYVNPARGYRAYEGKYPTLHDSIQFEVFSGDLPMNLADTFFISRLESIGYTRRLLSPAKHSQLDSVFCAQLEEDALSTTCIPNYRDILIFRRRGQVIGIAKVCFECFILDIKGTDEDYSSLTTPANFGHLAEILNHKWRDE